ncbi:hypothetical protein EDP1_2641 [Pseudomonas putida S610]|nr:hypothetical protein EDP1_2641 [Pseudomonas putida S610]
MCSEVLCQRSDCLVANHFAIVECVNGNSGKSAAEVLYKFNVLGVKLNVESGFRFPDFLLSGRSTSEITIVVY